MDAHSKNNSTTYGATHTDVKGTHTWGMTEMEKACYHVHDIL
jgi:hypothetical protein